MSDFPLRVVASVQHSSTGSFCPCAAPLWMTRRSLAQRAFSVLALVRLPYMATNSAAFRRGTLKARGKHNSSPWWAWVVLLRCSGSTSCVELGASSLRHEPSNGYYMTRSDASHPRCSSYHWGSERAIIRVRCAILPPNLSLARLGPIHLKDCDSLERSTCGQKAQNHESSSDDGHHHLICPP